MAELGAIALEILGYILQLLGVVQTIQGQQQEQASQALLTATEGEIITAKNAVTSPVSGNQALYSILGAIQTGTTPSLATITDLITALNPVTLPPSQPPGWSGDNTTNLLGAAVPVPWWGPGTNDAEFQSALFDIESNLLGLTGATGWPDRNGPWFALVEYWTPLQWGMVHPTEPAVPYLPPTDVDWTTWDGVQTLVEFLMASWPEYLWDHNGPAGYTTPGIVWGHVAAEVPARWRCLVEEWQLPFVSGRAWAAISGATLKVPPLWPGLDGVSLGTPVELTDSAILTGPMDGVLVDVTADKPGAGHFGTDGLRYTWRGGWLAFTDAAGRAEEYQYMGWSSAVYLPKHMAHAGGVCLILRDTLACTVTPFTISD